MSVTAAPAEPMRFAGLPLSAWAFALRNWCAMMLALYVAFWLQLESASSAATCVGILALQTRGQALQKAVYRTVGTIIGVTASFIIAGVFSQTRDLFFLACCVWLGLCVVMAGLLDGNRAYGAVLSGYTVAIVAIPNIDTPLSTFSSGVNRGAAITIGILAMALVSDVFQAPEVFPSVLKKIEAAQRNVKDFAAKALREGGAKPSEAAALLKELTALHPDITALPAESLPGRARAQAARTAVAALVRMVSAARVVAASLAAAGPTGDEPRDNLQKALEEQPHEDIRERALAVFADRTAASHRLIAAASCLVMFEQRQEAAHAIAAMREGKPPRARARLFLYKSRCAALRNGLRAGLALAITAFILSLLGWPNTVLTLTLTGALVGISATNPNPRGFAMAGLMAMPFVAVLGGVTQFLILDGVDQFELLVLGMGPSILLASLFLTSGKPALLGIGFLTLVFFPQSLSVSNPQEYDPQTYLYFTFLTVLGAICVFLSLSTVLPTTPKMQRRWMFGSARRDLREAVFDRRRRFDSLACAFRDADRIGQFSVLPSTGDREADLRTLIRMSDLASCARRIRTTVAETPMLRPIGQMAHEALVALDPTRLRDLGRALVVDSGGRTLPSRRILRQVGVDLLFAAVLIERSPRVVADLRKDAAR